jgi:hypothetical protein
MPLLRFVFFKRLLFFVRPFQVLGVMLSSPCFCNACSVPRVIFALRVIILLAAVSVLRSPQFTTVQVFLKTFLLRCSTVAWRDTFLHEAANFLQDPQFPRVSSFGSPRRPTANCGDRTENVAWRLTEVTWFFLTVARPSNYRVTQQQAERREAREREGRQDAAAIRYCCAIAFFEVSEFYHLPHGAITPHYFTVSDLRLPFSLPPTTHRVKWRYSTPPPHGFSLSLLSSLLL